MVGDSGQNKNPYRFETLRYPNILCYLGQERVNKRVVAHSQTKWALVPVSPLYKLGVDIHDDNMGEGKKILLWNLFHHVSFSIPCQIWHNLEGALYIISIFHFWTLLGISATNFSYAGVQKNLLRCIAQSLHLCKVHDCTVGYTLQLLTSSSGSVCHHQHHHP